MWPHAGVWTNTWVGVVKQCNPLAVGSTFCRGDSGRNQKSTNNSQWNNWKRGNSNLYVCLCGVNRYPCHSRVGGPAGRGHVHQSGGRTKVSSAQLHNTWLTIFTPGDWFSLLKIPEKAEFQLVGSDNRSLASLFHLQEAYVLMNPCFRRGLWEFMFLAGLGLWGLDLWAVFSHFSVLHCRPW